jgi:RNA polymerase sigma-70 factor (ECF subfamily)
MAEPPVEDAALVAALRAGDREALATVFSDNADRLYRLALGVLRRPDAAEDVVQTAFLRLLNKPESFDGRSKLSTWLYRVVYNASIDRLRAEKPTVPIEDENEDGAIPYPQDWTPWGHAPDERVERQEVRALLDAAIDALPASQRAVVTLRDVNGLSTEEAAAALGVTEGAVKLRLHRARIALRNALAEHFGSAATGDRR